MALDDPAATGPVLRHLVEASVREHGALLTADEHAAVEVFLALDPEAGHLYARLVQRVREVFRVDGLAEADHALLPTLEGAGLVDDHVPWPAALEALRVPELRAACGACGLSGAGPRADLLERLGDRRPAAVPALRRTVHRSLFLRLQRLLLRHPRADLRVVVLDLVGIQRHPSYDPGPGAPLFSCRADLLEFEQARAALDACHEGAAALPALERALGWLAAAPPPSPGARAFSTRRVAARLLAHAARELERAGEVSAALDLYLRLLEDGSLEAGDLVPRAVLAAGTRDPRAAVALAARWRSRLDPAAALAVDRSAARLARSAGLPWDVVGLRTPPVRRFDLPAAPAGGPRPLYRVPGADPVLSLPVEAALVQRLAALGRRALHAEAAPWTTLFALLMVDLYFLPVPGMLPVPWLSGPLDVGTPAFAEHRASALAARLAEVRAGVAPALVRARHALHEGEVLAGARWDVCGAEDLALLAEALGGIALATVLGRLAREGWQAARGLPDLVVLPGPGTDVPEARPSFLAGGLVLAEVKGPGDTLRDAQAVWLDLLLQAGAPAELWTVERAPIS